MGYKQRSKVPSPHPKTPWSEHLFCNFKIYNKNMLTKSRLSRDECLYGSALPHPLHWNPVSSPSLFLLPTFWRVSDFHQWWRGFIKRDYIFCIPSIISCPIVRRREPKFLLYFPIKLKYLNITATIYHEICVWKLDIYVLFEFCKILAHCFHLPMTDCRIYEISILQRTKLK